MLQAYTILVAEAQASLRRLIEVTLSGQPYRVVFAADGEEALGQARALRPDVMVLDIALPGRSGIDVCRAVKAAPATRDTRVVFVSAHVEREQQAWEAGGDAFLAKPFSPLRLAGAVGALLTPSGAATPGGLLMSASLAYVVEQARQRKGTRRARVEGRSRSALPGRTSNEVVIADGRHEHQHRGVESEEQEVDYQLIGRRAFVKATRRIEAEQDQRRGKQERQCVEVDGGLFAGSGAAEEKIANGDEPQRPDATTRDNMRMSWLTVILTTGTGCGPGRWLVADGYARRSL